MSDITQSKSKDEILDQLIQYQKALLGILSEINVNNCDDSLKEDIKSIYQLLNLLNQVATSKHETV